MADGRMSSEKELKSNRVARRVFVQEGLACILSIHNIISG